MSEEFRKVYGVREALAALGALGLTTEDALQLFRAFGDAAPQLVTDNPYLLCGYPLYKDFAVPEELAARFKIEPQDPRRIRAGLVFILRHNLGNGHTCIPTEKLIDTARPFLDIERDAVEIELYNAVGDGLLRVSACDGEERAFLTEMLRGESYIAERLLLLKRLQFAEPKDAEAQIEAFEKANGIEIPYTIEARRAGDIDENYCDPTRARELLGWVAERDLERMCRDSWNWQSENPDGYGI